MMLARCYDSLGGMFALPCTKNLALLLKMRVSYTQARIDITHGSVGLLSFSRGGAEFGEHLRDCRLFNYAGALFRGGL